MKISNDNSLTFFEHLQYYAANKTGRRTSATESLYLPPLKRLHMLLECTLTIKNYKCFGNDPHGFAVIKPINIVIGKNNSGKSTLIDLVEQAINRNSKVIPASLGTKCELNIPLTEEMLATTTRILVSSGHGAYPNDAAARPHLDKKILAIFPDRKISCSLQNDQLIPDTPIIQDLRDPLIRSINEHFPKHQFLRITAERDVRPEHFQKDIFLLPNGEGTTNIVWKHLNFDNYDQNLIKKEFLAALNEIIEPDIFFRDVIIKEEDPTTGNRTGTTAEICFEDKDGAWVRLSKMGSGVKTIILTLINLIILPKHKDIEKSELVLGFEELENNLHPALQRRLFLYITEYIKKNKAIIFITTHSNVVIDLFSENPDAQLLHVQKSGPVATVTKIADTTAGRTLLKELDFRASDILLSNGVVWVEGPSDALYLELLLDLYKKQFPETQRLNYSIQSLATALWKYAGFEDLDWSKINSGIQTRFISLAKINMNHLVVIDSDNNYEDKLPSAFGSFTNGIGQLKAKLIYESLVFGQHPENHLLNNYGDAKDGSLLFWITDGTFEAYLEDFIAGKGKEFAVYFDLEKSRGYLEKKRTGEHSSKSKMALALEIAAFVEQQKLSFEDLAPTGSALHEKITRMVTTIRKWN